MIVSRRLNKLKVLTSVMFTLTVMSACGSKTEKDQLSATPTSVPGATSSTQPQKEKVNLKWFIDGPANAKLPSAQDDFVKTEGSSRN